MADFGSLSPTDWTSFVTNAYNTYLGRAPDDPSLQSWVQNKDPNALINTLMNSQEGKAHELPLMYQSMMGRGVDQPSLDYYQNSSLNLNQIADILGSSPESESYFGSLGTPATKFSTDDVPKWKQIGFDEAGAGNRANALYSYYNNLFTSLGAKNPGLAASALTGGFGVESPGLDPTQKQIGGGPGRGLGQWEVGGRYDTVDPGNGALGLTPFAMQNGYDANTLEGQARFGGYELTSNPVYRRALEQLLSANDPISATRGALEYERPGGWSRGTPEMANGYQERLNNLNALQAFNGVGPPTSQQTMDFFRMQGAAKVPMPPTRPGAYDFGADPMVSIAPDARMDLVNAGITNMNPSGYQATPAQMVSIGGYNGLNSSLLNAGYTVGGGYSSGISPGVNPGGGAQGFGQAAGGDTSINTNSFTSGRDWGLGPGSGMSIYVPY